MSRDQKPKIARAGANKDLMRARLDQSNRENTVPNPKRTEVRRRKPKHPKKGWE